MDIVPQCGWISSMLNETSQTKRIHTVWFHAYKIQENTNKSTVTESRLVMGGVSHKREGLKETFGDSSYVLCLKWSDDFMGGDTC